MSIFYRAEGDKKNKALVFVHGGGSSGLMWKKQIEYFREKYYCIIPELKGNGSRSDEEYISIEDCAEEVSELIKSEKPGETVHLIGTSFGAAVATEVLNAHSDLIDHACINSCNLDSHPFWKNISLATIKAMLKMSVEKFKKMYRKYEIPDEAIEQLHADMTAVSYPNWKKLLSSTFDYRIKDGIRNVKSSVLVFLGTKETKMAIKSMRKLTEELPNSKGILVENETHSFCYQNPNLFNKIVEAWIEGKEIPGDTKNLI